MLEQLRRQSGSFIIWFLFAIIILAFVFTFGSQGGLQGGCGGAADDEVLVVNDQPVDVNSLRYGLNTLRAGSRAELVQMVLDQLVVREILAQAAASAGFRDSEDLANEHVKRGEFWVLGNKQDGKQLFMINGFDYKRLESLVNSWGLASVQLFVQEQRREILADMMRASLVQSAVASPEEARARFEQQHTTATVDAVVFRSALYRSSLRLSQDDVSRYLAEHGEDVQKKYNENERLYKDRKPEARVRMIMFTRQAAAKPGNKTIEATPPAKEGEEVGGEEAGEGAGAAGEGAGAAGEGAGESEAPAADPGKAAAENALAKLNAGADFAALATELSEDPRSKAKGGDVGWKRIDSPGLGAKELGDALAKLDVGQISDVIETPRGYYILKIEDKREGDLGYDQVKNEIAEGLALDYYAREGAMRDAQAALDQARAGKKLDELYERHVPAPRFNPQQLSPELLQQLEQQGITPEQLENMLRQQGGEQGALSYESADIPAESMWQGAAEANAADQPAPPKPAPAAGAGAASAGEARTGEVDAGKASAGASDGIPRPEGLSAPKVQNIGPFQRDADGEIQGIGESKELMDAIFDKLKAGELGPKVYEVDGSFVVVQVIERKNPDWEKFDDAEQARLMRSIANERGYIRYSEWIENRCRALATAGELRINQALVNQLATDDQDKQPFQYRACSTLRF